MKGILKFWIIINLFTFNLVFAEGNKTIIKKKIDCNFYLGIDYRITPIHLKAASISSVPLDIPYHNTDKLLSGSNAFFEYAVCNQKTGIGILGEFSLAYKQTYFESPILYDSNSITTSRANYSLVSDIQIGLFKRFKLKNNRELRVTVWTGSMNHGTSYAINRSFKTSYGMFYVRDEGSFKYNATSASLAYQKNKWLYELKFLFNNGQHNFYLRGGFIIPEMRIAYILK